MKTVKIFVSNKTRRNVVKSDIIQPIQTGRAIADEVFEDMIGDDTGDNISKENPRYNELSAQYWVWKNYDKIGNPDYVGFMHNRRHFIFNNKIDTENLSTWIPGINMFIVKGFNKPCQENIEDENIQNFIENSDFDCCAVTRNDINYFDRNDMYMKEHYIATIPGSKRVVWIAFENIVKELYPEYSEIFDKFAFGHYMNVCNMFIMKKELFNRYSEFCFNILGELDKRVNYRDFVGQEMRFLGFIAEYVLTIFIMKLEEENYKLKFIDACYIEDVDSVRESEDVPKKQDFLKKIFSITQSKKHSIITIFGLKIKIKSKFNQIKNDVTELKQMVEHLRCIIEHQNGIIDSQVTMLKTIETKVSDLQEEIILKQ